MNSERDVVKYVCDTLHKHETLTINEKGSGVVDYLGRSIKFQVFQWEGDIVCIDIELGVDIIEEYAQMYNNASGVTRLISSPSPALRLSCCIYELPCTDIILTLFENALEAWLILTSGFEQIQRDYEQIDPEIIPDDFDPESYYDQVIGNKLIGLTL
jgi:hypothetical protein